MNECNDRNILDLHSGGENLQPSTKLRSIYNSCAVFSQSTKLVTQEHKLKIDRFLFFWQFEGHLFYENDTCVLVSRYSVD